MLKKNLLVQYKTTFLLLKELSTGMNICEIYKGRYLQNPQEMLEIQITDSKQMI